MWITYSEIVIKDVNKKYPLFQNRALFCNKEQRLFSLKGHLMEDRYCLK